MSIGVETSMEAGVETGMEADVKAGAFPLRVPFNFSASVERATERPAYLISRK